MDSEKARRLAEALGTIESAEAELALALSTDNDELLSQAGDVYWEGQTKANEVISELTSEQFAADQTPQSDEQ